ncbi:MAG: hypothetical protein EG823_08830 [Actinobacteria bacterium]|nr:hypothetical protein [Actinomycetota bacterium]
MMRINLLPPEILDRRKAEKRIGWVVLAAIGVAVILVGVWAFAFLNLRGQEDELAAIQQQVQTTNAQAAQLAIFEERAAELESRRVTAAQALDGRRSWAKLFNELSLVLPSDVWIQTLSADQATGLQIAGYAVDVANDSPDAGHKAIAKMLVRLADLDQLRNVWLSSSTKSDFEEQPAIQFAVSAEVVDPTTGATQ